jgi:hypothetical protein
MDLHNPATTQRPRVAPGATVTAPRSTTAPGLDGRATGDLRSALEILADQMHEAAGRRRVSPPGTEAFRRADERVAYLIELFRLLQQRMAVPDEVWALALGPRDRENGPERVGPPDAWRRRKRRSLRRPSP